MENSVFKEKIETSESMPLIPVSIPIHRSFSLTQVIIMGRRTAYSKRLAKARAEVDRLEKLQASSKLRAVTSVSAVSLTPSQRKDPEPTATFEELVAQYTALEQSLEVLDRLGVNRASIIPRDMDVRCVRLLDVFDIQANLTEAARSCLQTALESFEGLRATLSSTNTSGLDELERLLTDACSLIDLSREFHESIRSIGIGSTKILATRVCKKGRDSHHLPELVHAFLPAKAEEPSPAPEAVSRPVRLLPPKNLNALKATGFATNSRRELHSDSRGSVGGSHHASGSGGSQTGLFPPIPGPKQ